MEGIAGNRQIAQLQRICDRQHIPYTPAGIKRLVTLGNGDLRFAAAALQAVVLSAGAVTSETVERSAIGSRDQTAGIQDFWRLLFLCSREHGRFIEGVSSQIGSGAIVSSVPQLFRHFYDIDADFAADGVMEYLPQLPVPDPTLQRLVAATAALAEYARILDVSKRRWDSRGSFT